MIRKTLKGTLCLVMAFYFAFLTLFGLGDFLYPDTMSRFHGDAVDGILCFSFAKEESLPAGSFDSIGEEEGRILAFGFLPVKNVQVRYYPKNQVICGGELFGIRMKTRGLLIASFGAVETKDGSLSPGESAGLEKGDILLQCAGVDLNSATDFVKLISKSGGKPVTLTVERGGVTLEKKLTPVLSADGSGWKAGLWVRDGAAGIGTVTFRDPVSGEFAGLGHAVCDADSRMPFPLQSGTVCGTSVESILKGETGKAGEIRGKLEKEELGQLLSNTVHGVYGRFTASPSSDETTVSIGLKEEVKPGEATILCTLDNNGKKEYKVRILEITDKERDTKNFILQVTDPALLEKTGGIVQGMSGSPILQGGKLIGAVTHVLVGDPTKGYGIFIENMLGNMPE